MKITFVITDIFLDCSNAFCWLLNLKEITALIIVFKDKVGCSKAYLILNIIKKYK